MSPILKKLLIAIIALIVIVCVILILRLDNRSEKNDAAVQTTFPEIKIAILNGCGVKGAATEIKEFIIKNNPGNIDVIAWRNVDRNMFIYNKSIIVVKKANDEKVDFLTNFTGIDRKILALDANVIEDMQIILGNDYKEIFK